MRLSQPQSRLRSLDVFRGVTIASMILVNSPGSPEDSYAFLQHAEWFGWTFADTIFPAFLWIVGVALTFSTGRTSGTRRESSLSPPGRGAALGVALSSAASCSTTSSFRSDRFLMSSSRRICSSPASCRRSPSAISPQRSIFLWGSWRGVIAGIVGAEPRLSRPDATSIPSRTVTPASGASIATSPATSTVSC